MSEENESKRVTVAFLPLSRLKAQLWHEVVGHSSSHTRRRELLLEQ
jgi:hypothetical protein